jgi:hypothetical protein
MAGYPQAATMSRRHLPPLNSPDPPCHRARLPGGPETAVDDFEDMAMTCSLRVCVPKRGSAGSTLLAALMTGLQVTITHDPRPAMKYAKGSSTTQLDLTAPELSPRRQS